MVFPDVFGNRAVSDSLGQGGVGWGGLPPGDIRAADLYFGAQVTCCP